MSFGEEYFRSGNYAGFNAGRTGKYYWARRFYASVVRRECKGGRLLEIGCGMGHLLARLQGHFQVHGIDTSEYAVAQAARIAIGSSVQVMRAEQIGALGAGAFDAIVAIHVFEHLEDPATVLRTCHEVLREEGLLLMVTPNLDAPMKRRKGRRWHGYNDPTHISLKTPDEWLKLLRHSGFEIKKRFGDGLWDVPYVPLLPARLQLLFFGLPGAIQALLCMPFVPVAWSESLIVLARNRGRGAGG